MVVSPLLLLPVSWLAPAGATDLELFETRIRPLIHEQCIKCHGPEKQKSGLRLDTVAGIRAGGSRGALFVAGRPEESLLVAALAYEKEDLQMPPRGRLEEAARRDVSEWIRQGAALPDERASARTAETAASSDASDASWDAEFARRKQHWCWQPVRPAPPPRVGDPSWPRDPVDAFILAELEQSGRAPAAEAARGTWLRRVTFDLIGLPPTLAEQDAFLEDETPAARARVVDRLLGSPHFGERWARHWLDLVRYAEGRGHEFDWTIPNAWQYRDYVIRALNADLPYAELLEEHVAGDLLDAPRLDPATGANESILGTGFWLLGESVHSPVDIRQDECDRVANQIDVFSKAFLGVTVACARCHDHKFDAISQRDYYALAGFLAGASERQAPFEALPANRRVAAEVVARRGGQETALRRELVVSLGPAVARSAALLAEDAALLDAFLHAAAPAVPGLFPAEGSAEGAAADGTVVVDFDRPRSGDWTADGVAFGLTPLAAGALRQRPSPDAPVFELAPTGIVARDALLDRVRAAPDREQDPCKLKPLDPGRLFRTRSWLLEHGRLHYLVRGQGHLFACVDSHRTLEGPLHQGTLVEFDTKGAWRWITHELGDYVGHRVHVEFSLAPLSPEGVAPDLAVAAIVDAREPPGAPARVNRLVAVELGGGDDADAVARALTKALATLEQDELPDSADFRDAIALVNVLLARPELFPRTPAPLAAAFVAEQIALARSLRDGSRVGPALLDGSAFDERLLVRGNPKTPAERVPRRFLSAIDGDAGDGGNEPLAGAAGSGRRELAARLVAPGNPLMARVAVNRIWAHLFGGGIVPTLDDFGALGEPPSHPGLLDHLAARFVGDGGSQKRLIRALVLSSTYAMDAPVRRLEAEPLRDAILAVSGRLDRTLFGPSVPTYVTPFMDGRGKPPSGPLDGQGRRTIYLSVKRNFLSPFLLAFDFPIPATTCGRRSVSNVPAQALTLMNGEFVQEEARRWAQRHVEGGPATPAARIVTMYREAFARPPDSDELAAAERFLAEQAAACGTGLQDLALWSDLAHVLLCHKEFRFLR